MNKKGQFFLIATIIIAGLIITLSTIYISTKTTKEDTSIYDLSKEINYESNQVIDYGVYKSVSGEKTSSYLTNLTNYYVAASPGTELLVVHGNESVMSATYYGENPSGILGVNVGGGTVGDLILVQTASNLTTEYIEEEDFTKVRVWLNVTENAYADFELKPGENFYLILQRQKGEETLVARE
jgi:hypothetical protein